ncbi:MAG: hypothetical protein LIP77_02435 [Planctomycetes bacterium]|nr:hypothetical protein [Planctomycetota bacterium]
MAMELTAPEVRPLAEVTGYAPWRETERGRQCESAYSLRMKIVRGVQLAIPSVVVAYMFTIFSLDGMGIAILMLALWIAVYVITGRTLQGVRRFIISRRDRARQRYAREIAQDYGSKAGMAFYVAETADADTLLWQQGGYALFSPLVADMARVPVAHLLEVNLEHVQLGATTRTETRSSDSGIGMHIGGGVAVGFGGGKARSKSHTTTHYEWRMDLMNDWEAVPSFTFVFPETEEPTAKNAYAVLKGGQKRHATSCVGQPAPAVEAS